MKRRQLILVIDDDGEMLKMLTRVLEIEGYDVATTADGREALALLDILEQRGLSLVILDIMMPQLDGFQVLSLIRQRSSIPIVMLTAKCEVSCLRQAMAEGADDYVKKPFSTRELVARVRAKLRRAKPGDAFCPSIKSLRGCANTTSFNSQ